jgi:hypothetical protein
MFRFSKFYSPRGSSTVSPASDETPSNAGKAGKETNYLLREHEAGKAKMLPSGDKGSYQFSPLRKVPCFETSVHSGRIHHYFKWMGVRETSRRAKGRAIKSIRVCLDDPLSFNEQYISEEVRNVLISLFPEKIMERRGDNEFFWKFSKSEQESQEGDFIVQFNCMFSRKLIERGLSNIYYFDNE